MPRRSNNSAQLPVGASQLGDIDIPVVSDYSPYIGPMVEVATGGNNTFTSGGAFHGPINPEVGYVPTGLMQPVVAPLAPDQIFTQPSSEPIFTEEPAGMVPKSPVKPNRQRTGGGRGRVQITRPRNPEITAQQSGQNLARNMGGTYLDQGQHVAGRGSDNSLQAFSNSGLGQASPSPGDTVSHIYENPETGEQRHARKLPRGNNNPGYSTTRQAMGKWKSKDGKHAILKVSPQLLPHLQEYFGDTGMIEDYDGDGIPNELDPTPHG